MLCLDGNARDGHLFRQWLRDCTVRTLSCVVINIGISHFIPSSATDLVRYETRRDVCASNLAQSFQQHPSFVAGSTATKRWLNCCWRTIFARSLLEERVQDDGARVTRLTRCDQSVFRARPRETRRQRTGSPLFKLTAVCPKCESVGVLLKDSTSTCIFDALVEGSHAAAAPEFAGPVHTEKSSLCLADIGTGVWSQEGVAVPMYLEATCS